MDWAVFPLAERLMVSWYGNKRYGENLHTTFESLWEANRATSRGGGVVVVSKKRNTSYWSWWWHGVGGAPTYRNSKVTSAHW